jgi:hypothetical protein
MLERTKIEIGCDHGLPAAIGILISDLLAKVMASG